MTWGTQDRTSIPVSAPLHPPLYLSFRLVRFRFSHRLRSVLNSLHNTPLPSPTPPPSSHHFRVVGANAPSNSDIILLLALQILSL